MKYTYDIGFRDGTKDESIESDYLPQYLENKRTGDIFLFIQGKECGYYYYATNCFIKCIYTKI